MVRTIILTLCLVLGLVAMACSKTEPTTNTNTNSSTTEKPAASTPATTTASTSSDSIGVPECDDFIAKYEACVSNKVPEMVRAQYQASLKQWKDSWKKLADNPATRPSLASACKQSLEQAKTSLNAFNCAW